MLCQVGIIRIKRDRVGIYCNIMYVLSPTLAPQRELYFADLASSSKEMCALTHLLSGFLMKTVELKGKSQNWKGRRKNGQVARFHF